MTGRITYIATPIGHLDTPYWRTIAAYPGGDTAIVIGIQLRDLAAQVQRGGRLVLPNGTPMSIPMIAATLGRDATQIEFALGILTQVGTVMRDDVTIYVTDPLLLEHFERTSALAIPDKKKQKRALSAARSKKYRQRKRNSEVTPASRSHHATERDESIQQPDITGSAKRHDMFIDYRDISSSVQTHGDDEDHNQPDLTPILRDVPLHKVRQLKPLILAALSAGHELRTCQLAISEGKRSADPGRSPWGLVQHYLRELSETQPLQIMKPEPRPSVMVDTNASAAEAVFTWVESL